MIADRWIIGACRGDIIIVGGVARASDGIGGEEFVITRPAVIVEGVKGEAKI